MREKNFTSLGTWLMPFNFVAIILTLALFPSKSLAQANLLKAEKYGKDAKVVAVKDDAKQVSTIVIPDRLIPEGFVKSVKIAFPDRWAEAPVVAIGENVFDSCQELTNISIPKSVSEIDPNAFINVEKLAQIDVNDDNPRYFSSDGVLYQKEGVGALLLCYPQGKTGDAFFINQVVRKNGGNSTPFVVTRIGYAAFYKSGLTLVNVPKSVVEIGDNAFQNSKKLMTITLNEGLKKINRESFAGCSSISAITLPETLVSLGDRAFMGCQKLKKIRIPGGVTTIGENAFSDCLELLQFEVASENKNFTAMDGVLFTKSYDKLIQYPSSRNNDSYTVPKQTQKLGVRAFADNQAIQTATIPEGIGVVSAFCFANCSALKRVELPKSVEKINEGAFKGCSSLASVNFSGNLKEIGKESFEFCASLKSIELPEGLETIKSSAFAHCSSLESIRIPKSVTSIGASAFEGCSSLKKVELLSENLWQKIDESVFKDCGAIGDIAIP